MWIPKCQVTIGHLLLPNLTTFKHTGAAQTTVDVSSIPHYANTKLVLIDHGVGCILPDTRIIGRQSASSHERGFLECNPQHRFRI